MSIIGLMVAVIGFGKTFFLPLSTGSFKAPPIVHIHGGFAFAWVALFVIQPTLIHFRNYRTHMVLGVFGVFIAAGISITMIPTAIFAAHKELAQGLGKTAYSGLLGVATSGLLFFSLVLAGVLNR